jgi:hypothetical protein
VDIHDGGTGPLGGGHDVKPEILVIIGGKCHDAPGSLNLGLQLAFPHRRCSFYARPGIFLAGHVEVHGQIMMRKIGSLTPFEAIGTELGRGAPQPAGELA